MKEIRIKYWREAILIIFAVIMALLIIGSFSSLVFYKNADEGYYLRYAQKVLNSGLPGLRNLLSTYIANSSSWGFPVPLRFGFIISSAFFCGLFGLSFFSIVYLCLLAFFGTAFFAYKFCRKTFGDDVSFLAGLLFLSSPLALALSRRALSDGVANFFLLLTIILQIDYFNSGCRSWKKWLLAVTLFLAVAFKETNILFIFPLAISSLAFLSVKNFRQVAKLWVIIYLLPVAFIFIMYKFLYANIADAFMSLFFLTSAEAFKYGKYFQSGPWFRYVVDFTLISPWVTILSIYYSIYVFINKRKKSELALVLFIVSTIFIFSFFSKNIRYISVIDYPLRIFTAICLVSVNIRDNKKAAFLLAFFVIVLICVFDLINFFRIFVWGGVYDPVSFGLLSFWHIIPTRF
jgi:4-amino-4-deoxy-L-arabinose transferase-like glycosyltransferase